MTDDARAESVAEEVALGDAALRAAEVLASLALNHDALSRLYFAAFHWARALLASAGIEPRTHQGVQSLLGLHFVRAGRLEPRFQQTLSRLETWRGKADYTRGFVADDALVSRELGEARALRTRMLELIALAPPA